MELMERRSLPLPGLTRRENFCNQLELFSAFVDGADLIKTPERTIPGSRMKERIAKRSQTNIGELPRRQPSEMKKVEMAAETDAEVSDEMPAETPAELPAELTDDELVVAARGGDEAAFTRLFDRHRRLVSRLGYRFFPRRDQVERSSSRVLSQPISRWVIIRGAMRSRSFRGWPGSRYGPVMTNCGACNGGARATSAILGGEKRAHPTQSLANSARRATATGGAPPPARGRK